MTVNLRALTAKKNAFLWLPENLKDFEKVKRLLTSDMFVTHFDPSLPVTVLTDPSRLHRLGYAMGHFIDGKFKVVACGSKSLSLTQQRYATIELVYLAVHFALNKCLFYLKGAPSFNVLTDHKPLEGIFRKDMFDIDNPRLQRICEKLLEYCFTVTRVPGKSHLIADALSRAPLFAPEEIEDIAIDTARVCLGKASSGKLDMIFDAIDADVKSRTLDSVYSKQLILVKSQ